MRISFQRQRTPGGQTDALHTSRNGARSLRTCPCISGRLPQHQTHALRSSESRAHEGDYETLITLHRNGAHSRAEVCHTGRIKNGKRHLPEQEQEKRQRRRCTAHVHHRYVESISVPHLHFPACLQFPCSKCPVDQHTVLGFSFGAPPLLTHPHCAPKIQCHTPKSLDPPLCMTIFGQLFTVAEALLGPQQPRPVRVMLLSHMAPTKEDRRPAKPERLLLKSELSQIYQR